ncbi:TPA: recombinase family protein [Raoultella ornithinolytica]|jgi:DNA invertase Pin-like site-specific DNA recombinase|uniref:recombinase family protein n=1 Tax=Enterobacteriaceae TaxID=543 RepID=UPI000A2D5222|nr:MULTISPECIES: recombinase family protein [Enterobacteriaceae]ELA1953966.1 recombinase family protein [Klebsiella variicola]HCB1464489.1 recombinase family protein [Citrobacter freundii]HDR2796612.1 recombinase family protein [Enterobacter asburiae]MCW9325956.1 recombinase family protein [Klebsiella quasipneumoniae]MCW9336551.1 recombinase family protein [Klebsiella quasipneumoniae]
MAVIGYARVSTDEQTVENQRQQLAVYNVERWFIDEGISGTKEALKRDGFGTLMNYVREGDTVVCVAIDRIGRNTIDVLSTVEALKTKGVKLISNREGFDLSTPAGEAMLTIMAALAKLELATLAERRAAGIKRAQAAGKHCGRPAKSDSATVTGLFNAGKTWREIAEITGLSKASIYRLRSQVMVAGQN